MSDPIVFPSSTPTLGLPLLAAGQAQKEFFVNQALCLLDAIHPRAVTSSRSAPPASAEEGECFRITASATEAWAELENHIAVLIGGEWHFIAPSEGMQLFDQAASRALVFRTQWMFATAPVLPTGGDVIDIEARATVAALIQSLLATGVLGLPTP